MSERTRVNLIRLGMVVAVAASSSGMPGCRRQTSDKPPRQFLPDLDDQMRWNPQSESPFFADGRTMREPVPGTVPYGRWDGVHGEHEWDESFRVQRTLFLKEDKKVFSGVESIDADGNPVYRLRIPMSVDRAMVERGRDRYTIYCTPCHGYLGDGKGLVGQRWAYALPSFHDEKYKDPAQKGRDGLIFHTIRNGVVGPTGAQLMPSYARAINEYDAWAIVAYVRALQKAAPVLPQPAPVEEPSPGAGSADVAEDSGQGAEQAPAEGGQQ